MLRCVFALLAVLFCVEAADAQSGPVADQQLAWRSYSAPRQARVRLFHADDERRPRTVVIDDCAANGAPITDEATFVADLAARELGFDPTEATFVFRFSPAAFDGEARDSGKTLLLRATFSRGASGNLGSPQWRVITADALDALTDRAFR